ncbi:TonB-dependent receptor [Spirosoma sp.]|uniref:TonB-dependent receptor n=1 Tax=Spirosoma sp. TaxID=1899569 RepID=UPI002635F7DF|nr:TonB-dependent receptor [Spirosoma sp.]MCX6213082.1 TonB-dependent receptor [Spirosoma sp.]
MKLSLTQLLFFVAFIQLAYAGESEAQDVLNRHLTLKVSHTELKQVLRQIEAQTNVKFAFSRNTIKADRPVSLDVTKMPLEQVLKQLLTPLDISYRVVSERILLTNSVTSAESSTKTNLGFSSTVVKAVSSAPVAETRLTGVVRDEQNNEPLPGVSIVAKGTNRGTTTDANGRYQLTVPDETTVLVFSFVGYTSKEVPISSRTTVDISLVPDDQTLNEVVVVGYGTVKKSDLTGSVSSVTADQIKKTVNTSLDQALAGRAAGVQVTQASGQPGGAISIRIRGGNSVNGGNEPLYVIDGFPVYSDNSTATSGANRGPATNALASINPNDIESMEILKDASATAIYGTRGANGVVIITTKRGKSGQNNIDFETYYGVQEPRRLIPMMNAKEYATMVNEARTNDGLAPYYTADQLAGFGEGTNWQKEIFRTAPIQNYQLTFSGGNAKTRYAISTSYFGQQGTIIHSNFNRISTRVNLDHSFTDRFRIGNSLTVSRTKADIVVTDTDGGGNTGVVLGALLFQPTLPVRNADGTFVNRSDLGEYGNPVAYANEITNKSTTFRALGNIFAEYDILKDLTARVSFGADVLMNKGDFYIPSTNFYGLSTKGLGTAASVLNTTWLNENTLSYRHSFANKNSVNAVVGFTMQGSQAESVRASSQNFPNDILGPYNLGSGATINFPNTTNNSWGLLSYLGRINYNIADKYLLTFTGRADGSSRFGLGNKYAFFPSGAIAWRVANESFMRDQAVVSDLKLRASVGVTGNQEIGQFQSLATLTNATYVLGEAVAIGYTPARFANPNLRWEKTTQFDAGLDASFLKGRLNLTLDAYYKRTNDLLLAVTVPWTSGFSTSLQNIGSAENKGLELAINSVNTTGAFKWTSAFNIAFNRNKILDLGQITQFFSGGDSGHLKITNPSLVKVGEPIGRFYGYIADGVFRSTEEVSKSAQKSAKPGDRRYVDLNGDGVINASDRTYIGNAQPKFIGGLTNTFAYKGFELTVFMQYSYGNDIFNYNKIELELPAGIQNLRKDVVDRWSLTNPNGQYPRATTNRTIEFSSQYIEDGSYLRARNVSLAYQIPSAFLKRLRIRTARVNLSSQNLFTITNYTGYDPEVSRYGQTNLNIGQDYGGYPIARTVLLGLNLGF